MVGSDNRNRFGWVDSGSLCGIAGTGLISRGVLGGGQWELVWNYGDRMN
jgi:hypothetical protein